MENDFSVIFTMHNEGNIKIPLEIICKGKNEILLLYSYFLLFKAIFCAVAFSKGQFLFKNE